MILINNNKNNIFISNKYIKIYYIKIMIDYIQDNYIFDNFYKISSHDLNVFFIKKAALINPSNNDLLSQTNIMQLETIVFNNNDNNLLKTINYLKYNNPPSPIKTNTNTLYMREMNSPNNPVGVIYSQYDDDNIFIREHIDSFNKNKTDTLDILYNILNIGLHLCGWNDKEPYITKIKTNCNVNVELKIQPLIENLYKNQLFSLIKTFPIINYLLQNNEYYPNIQDNNKTISTVFNQLVNNNNDIKSGNFLITTSYYYLTNLCKKSLPTLEPLILNISK